MPGINGIEAIEAIRGEFPQARIIVLTTAAGDVQAVRAFKAGALGYLLKNLLRTELVETIRTVHSGRKRIPPEVAQQIAEHAADDSITSRELDVLRGVAKGSSFPSLAVHAVWMNWLMSLSGSSPQACRAILDTHKDRSNATMRVSRRFLLM